MVVRKKKSLAITWVVDKKGRNDLFLIHIADNISLAINQMIDHNKANSNTYIRLTPTLQPVSTEAMISSLGINSVGNAARRILALCKIAPRNLE